jgi:hypothetical protein
MTFGPADWTTWAKERVKSLLVDQSFSDSSISVVIKGQCPGSNHQLIR